MVSKRNRESGSLRGLVVRKTKLWLKWGRDLGWVPFTSSYPPFAQVAGKGLWEMVKARPELSC